ncbi:hypothetical protein OROMI_034063 [Orobanche minor]
MEKWVTAINRELPPTNEQFIYDFEQIQRQFPEQLRGVTESVVKLLVIQCCDHAPRAEFLVFALRSLCIIGCIKWDAFLPCLLSSVTSAETPVGQTSAAVTCATSSQSVGGLPTSNTFSNSNNFQSSMAEPSSCATLKSQDVICTGAQQSARSNLFVRENAISSLRQLSCKIILIGLEFNLMPVTRADIFNHVLNWLVNWDQKQRVDEFDIWRPNKALMEWLHNCLDDLAFN